MSYEKPALPPVTRYISRGQLRIECFVTHRDAKVVKYHFGDVDRDGKADMLYERSPAAFDAAYQVPVLPARR